MSKLGEEILKKHFVEVLDTEEPELKWLIDTYYQRFLEGDKNEEVFNTLSEKLVTMLNENNITEDVVTFLDIINSYLMKRIVSELTKSYN